MKNDISEDCLPRLVVCFGVFHVFELIMNLLFLASIILASIMRPLCLALHYQNQMISFVLHLAACTSCTD